MKRLLPLVILAACGPDETVSGFGSDSDYVLQDMNGVSISTPITFNIGETGRISGQAPCNSYAAEQSAPYPWFVLGPISTTRMACPDLALETDYLALLARMTLVEVGGTVVILSNDAKEMMVFQTP